MDDELFAQRIADAFIASCRDELHAPKPGNVHVFSTSTGKTPDDFLRSAEAAAGPLSAPGARVGLRILGAVEATRAAVGSNTNLGIVLLCAPLAAAAERRSTDLRTALAGVLAGLDVTDAELAFRAIVTARPGGLGRVRSHDVFMPARTGLREAMTVAAARDRIAAQYAADFEDVFGLGWPAFNGALARGVDSNWAVLEVFMEFLADFPDSHVMREHGAETAEEVRETAGRLRMLMRSGPPPAEFVPELLSVDRGWKARSINPGTSADLTVATLFVHRLRNILPSGANNG
jgi:triphosphoribosyl-dephospho-CoA synthase